VSGSGISWAICKSASCPRQITMPAPHHSVFLQAGCPFWRPTNSVKALKTTYLLTYFSHWSSLPWRQWGWWTRTAVDVADTRGLSLWVRLMQTGPAMGHADLAVVVATLDQSHQNAHSATPSMHLTVMHRDWSTESRFYATLKTQNRSFRQRSSQPNSWLGGRKGRVLAWLSVWSEVQICIWPSLCHCQSLFLASVKSRLVLPFCYQLIRVVLYKAQLLNGCVWNQTTQKQSGLS